MCRVEKEVGLPVLEGGAVGGEEDVEGSLGGGGEGVLVVVGRFIIFVGIVGKGLDSQSSRIICIDIDIIIRSSCSNSNSVGDGVMISFQRRLISITNQE